MTDETVPVTTPPTDTRTQIQMLLDLLNPTIGTNLIEQYLPSIVTLLLVIYGALEASGTTLPSWALVVGTILTALAGWYGRHSA